MGFISVLMVFSLIVSVGLSVKIVMFFRDVGVILFIVGKMVFGVVFFMFVRRCKVSVWF